MVVVSSVQEIAYLVLKITHQPMLNLFTYV